MNLLITLSVIAVILLYNAIKIVPQQESWLIERLGKFQCLLEPGLSFIIPFIDKVAYKHSLKEEVIDVFEQTAITSDNVSLRIDGVLYVRIQNPFDASYGVKDPYFAVVQLAQTAMRSVIGTMTMDRTFEERDTMNGFIVSTIREAARPWGIECLRYEIKDIHPPINILKAMELQVEAERRKRAEILESEGKRQAQINLAESYKQEVVLKSEAALIDKVNRAKGEAEAICAVANATRDALFAVAESLHTEEGSQAVSLRLAEQYIEAFKNLARESTAFILPSNVHDVGAGVGQAMAIWKHFSGDNATEEAPQKTVKRESVPLHKGSVPLF